jgi:trk system potassium uptake protein
MRNRSPFPFGKILDFHPATLVLSSFLLAVAIGTFFLSLPFATQTGSISFMDALFTATSAVCVTGLIVVDTGTYFTPLGQGVILALIQIGGLGVMTVSVMLFRAIGRSISFRQRLVMQDVFSPSPREDILKLVKMILVFTVTVEAAGFLLLLLHWSREYPAGEAIYIALFHSVSAFCNAGFSLFAHSMMDYRDDLLLNLSMCALIILGGIGFPVVYDLYTRAKTRNQRHPKLTLQTRLVLVTTLSLLLLGALLFWVLERPHALSGKPAMETMLVSLFQSTTCRTAGFNTVDISTLTDATLTMMMVLMFFGASPGSCGGGVKTTTLAILAAFTWSRIQRKSHLNLFKKSIPVEAIHRAISLTLLSAVLIGVVLFLLSAGDSVAFFYPALLESRFLSYLFESVSAFGTVGLSMGATAALSPWGKGWIIFLMLVGRVGVLTFAYIIVGGGFERGVEYSRENVMIG